MARGRKSAGPHHRPAGGLLHLERANISGALGAAGISLSDGGAASFPVLRGVSRDRLDLLGEEYFKYKLQPNLKPDGVRQLETLINSGAEVVLVSQGLDHVMRPLARHLGARWLVVNRLEFRDGIATGRLLEPIIRPRGLFARITGAGPDGKRLAEQLTRDLDLRRLESLESALSPAEREAPKRFVPIVHFDGDGATSPLSVRAVLSGKRVMLIGVTGFIGKVWLVNTLSELPEVGRIYLLIRRQKSNPAAQRFEKLVETSPVFDPLFKRYGTDLPRFLGERVEIIEGDVTEPGLGLAPEESYRFQSRSARRVDDQRRRRFEHSGFCSPVGSCGTSSPFHLLRSWGARWQSERDVASQLHSGRSAKF
ncbi:MAG: hypothetical protein AUI85_03995 [Acidobacteriales bacterium 13_1_40CM_3_55_5]|nr:MAG: hypothetical protein AUI85_03995 [Acidobacteriales bacterium 13_1_40CM_3_55_5]